MIESLYILILCAAACSLLGVFMVLRKLSMVADAISHSVLLGIVLAVFIVNSLNSIWLIVGAALFGVLTVVSIELLVQTKLVKNDASVGIVFPLFFSIGVILITKYGRKLNLDTECVIMGEVIMSPLKRMDFLGLNLPVSVVQMGIILIINIAFIVAFFKELKLLCFDKEFSFLSGFSAAFLSYSLMTLVSVTTVIAFDAIGAILVIAFMITPAATATLVTKDLKYTLIAAVGFGVFNSIGGYYLSVWLNVSMAGMTAFMMGLTFVMVLLFSGDGVIVSQMRRRAQRRELFYDAFLIHLSRHKDNIAQEHGIGSIKHHLNWSEALIVKRSKVLQDRGLVTVDSQSSIFKLTKKGKEYCSKIHPFL